MPEGKKAAVPAPKPVREEDLYSAKTHLHQPVPVQETATVSATAQLADAPEGALPSEVRPEIVTWEKLCEAIKASGRSYNMEMIEKAYDLANTAHKGVCRRSGEPYICHPLAVARLVLDLGMDSESIAAALLHDVVEDTPTTLDDLKAAFGEEVALLVDGVTKLTKIQFSNIEELQAENLRKMLLAMSRDVRVMIIKLCDRLHNMRTGDAWPEQKRRDKARETMEVYAPIANRLGILNVKEELEDRSLHYLDPVGYEEISRMLSERAGEEFLAKVSGVIERRLAESGIEGATIKRRVKSIYGIYRKTIMQNKSFDEIYDIYAVRVILDTLAGVFTPLMPLIAGAGMIKALLSVLTLFGWIDKSGNLYYFLNFIADSSYYFLPIFLANSAAKKFGCNPQMAMLLGAILLHPNFIALKADADVVHVLGLPVKMVTYSSSVIPIFLITLVLPYVERFVNKVVPSVVKFILRPVLTILIMAPISLCVLGPLGSIIGDGLVSVLLAIEKVCPWALPTVIGAFMPFLVMTGMHYSLLPAYVNSLSMLGYETVIGPGNLPSNIAQGAAALCVAIKTKNKNFRQLAVSGGVTALLGVTEPALFGVNVRLRKPQVGGQAVLGRQT